MDNSVYEHRAVLFLDVLGFGELIRAGRASEIIEVLKTTEGLKNKYPFDESRTMDISSFSDSIVVSATVGDGFGVVRIVHYAAHLAWKFLNLGILTRGGIASGEMYHEGGIAFGPALLDAYKLESKLAIYPRILVSTEVHNQFIEYQAMTKPSFIEGSCGILREDLDIQVHVNLMSPFCASVPESFADKKQPNEHGAISYSDAEILKAKKACIDEAISRNSSSEIEHLVKLGWLKRYADGF